MNIDYAQWPADADRPSEPSSALVADAIFYEIIRLRVRPTGWNPAEESRFADVAVTTRDGFARFIAGYSTLSGAADGSGPIELWAHAPAVAEITRDQDLSGGWTMSFVASSVVDDADGLVILDCGFGVVAPQESISWNGSQLQVALNHSAEVLVVSGPSADRIRNRRRLATDQLGLLPSY